MGRIRTWLYGWRSTLFIMLFDRETYRALKRPLDPDDDFGTVPRPGGDDDAN